MLIVLLVVIIIASIRRRDDFVNVDSATRQEIDSTIKTGRRLTLAMTGLTPAHAGGDKKRDRGPV